MWWTFLFSCMVLLPQETHSDLFDYYIQSIFPILLYLETRQIFCSDPCFDNFVGSCKRRLSVVLLGPIMYQFKTTGPLNQHGSLNESCSNKQHFFFVCFGLWQWGSELYLSTSRSLFLDPFKGSVLYFLIQAQGRIIWEMGWLWEDKHNNKTQKTTPIFVFWFQLFNFQPLVTKISCLCHCNTLGNHIISWLTNTLFKTQFSGRAVC